MSVSSNNNKKSLASTAISAQLRFQQEKKKTLLKTIIATLIVGVSSLFVFTLALGGAFEGILAIFGLSALKNEARGIYADCTLSQNKGSRYCQNAKQINREVEWRQLSQSGRGSSKFRLSD